MKRTRFEQMAWAEFIWRRPFEVEAVMELLIHLASHSPQTIPIAFEARGTQQRARYYIGVNRQYMRKIQSVFKAHGDIQFRNAPKDARTPVSEARQLKISRPALSLNTELTEAVLRAGLSALTNMRGKEQVVLQVLLGSPYQASPMPQNLPDPHAGWLQVAFGTVAPATAESRAAVKEKISKQGFYACIRLGAYGTRTTAPAHILSLLSALRTLSAAGVNIRAVGEKPEKLDLAHAPWHWPLRLSVVEIANLMMLPTGENFLPGTSGLHPKEVLPPSWYREPARGQERTFAVSLDGQTRLSITTKDAMEHLHVLGPTGVGKSTCLLHLILSDIRSGKSVLVLDPKADLVQSILERIPAERDDDVVIIDPSSPNSVGLNPFSFKKDYDPGLIADAILAVFQEVFKENWGIRSQDVLAHSLLTLAKSKDATLLWLPTMLTNETFRRSITSKIDDKLGLEPFWTAFESMKDSERRQEILPVLNKLRQFLLRPGLRNILGQSQPKFNLTELFSKPRIVLCPLNRGLIGAESSKLLGSLIVGLTWTLALSRASLPPEKRRPVIAYLDEFQDFLALPTDMSDALAQSRGLSLGLVLAHQYKEQLPPEIRAGVDANARNKIIFNLSAQDAKSMAAMAPELTPEDFIALPRYQIYTSFNQNGRNTGWISGKTLPMPKATRNPNELRAKVAARYGKSGKEVEREYMELLARCQNSAAAAGAEDTSAPIGRRKTK